MTQSKLMTKRPTEWGMGCWGGGRFYLADFERGAILFSRNKVNKFNPLSANCTKWSNTLEQFSGNGRQDHFVGLVLKRLMDIDF